VKRHLSVFGMFARQNLGWLFAFCALSVLMQSWFFAGICMEQPQELHTALIHYESNHAFVFCFLFLTVRLCITGCDRSGKSVYTYHRLQVSQKEVFLLQAAFNLLAYWFFFTVQMILMLVFAIIYSHIYPEYIGPMSLVQAIYRVPLFRLVLPLQDLFTWAGNVGTLASLSLCTAVFPLRNRYGKVSISAIMMILLTVFYLYIQIYENTYFDISASILSLACSAFLVAGAVGGVWTTEGDNYE